jgi:very-short-patch-repair endonuclease
VNISVVEMNGKIHRYRKVEDNLRTEILGKEVLRFFNKEVENE